eukprot:CAMPEP_0171110394 /NCGR_PEP_ID=MMETSP0766_2-20121228/71325_1 /TAXON_ID=439317 /ORGANISM="Gambierdiscus australes, Strain CAWD 149" /LENGTH=107 /DNA_ID=CAMNT_0011572257 /DNA_START=392 /DNA_END=715 /DNA_ORIENTATION=+
MKFERIRESFTSQSTSSYVRPKNPALGTNVDPVQCSFTASTKFAHSKLQDSPAFFSGEQTPLAPGKMFGYSDAVLLCNAYSSRAMSHRFLKYPRLHADCLWNSPKKL